MHYVLCIKVGASPLTELGSALTLCIKRFMHYYHMHCDDFNCTGLPKMQWIAELLKILPPYCRRPEVGWEGCFLSMSSEIETKGECAHFLVSLAYGLS